VDITLSTARPCVRPACKLGKIPSSEVSVTYCIKSIKKLVQFVGSAEKAFCAVHLSSFSANYAQLYPHKLWINFDAASRAAQCRGRRLARSAIYALRRAADSRAAMPSPATRILHDRSRAGMGTDKPALLKSPAEAKVSAAKYFQENQFCLRLSPPQAGRFIRC